MLDSLTGTFAAAPFALSGKDVEWVEDRFAALDTRSKAALVFSVMTIGPALDNDSLKALQPGFLTRMQGGDAAHQSAQLAALNAGLAVPIVVNTDLEGSTTSLPDGMATPNPMAFAAANDPHLTGLAALAMGHEARQFGMRWSFTPAIDLNLAFRSAVVGTRSFGSDLETVRAQGIATLRGLQAAGVAATVKHWPGEGTDPRDQHLVTTINDMPFDAWQKTYGSLYQSAIDAGALAVMSAHVGLPSYMKEVAGIDGPNAYLPGCLNRHLNEDLLRGQLGFNGLIVSDATAMAGISGLRKRDDLVIDILNAGCDVILGSFDLAADVAAIMAAIDEGRLSKARLDAAVLRQLAMKATLGVHKSPAPVPAPDPAPIARVLEQAPTLVRARDGLLPVTPERYRKIYVVSRGVGVPPASPTAPLPLAFKEMLKEAGFDVVAHDWGTPVDPAGCDLLLYVYAEETLLTRGVIANDWAAMNGNFIAAMRRHWHDIPTLMISFGWPYHLYEAPQVHGYINAYMAHPAMQAVTLDAMTGKRPFAGTSPIDPYCGLGKDYFAL